MLARKKGEEKKYIYMRLRNITKDYHFSFSPSAASLSLCIHLSLSLCGYPQKRRFGFLAIF